MPPRKSTESLDELKVIEDLSSLFSSTLELSDTLQETINLISKLTKADACFLYLYDKGQNDLVLSASKTPHPQEIGQIRIGLNKGITGWVAKHHKPVFISKEAQKDPRFLGTLPEDNFQSLLSIPIQVKSKVIGVINAQHKKPFKHTPRLVKLLTTIGKQVGGAIETARLYDETRRRSQAIEALNEVSHTLNQDQYPEEIMQMIVNMTAKLMQANICSIMLLDEKKNELKIVASQSLDPAYRNKPPVKVNGSLSGRAVLSKQPLVISDVRKEPSYQYQDLAIKQGLVSLLSVPMLYKSKCMGLLNFYTPDEHQFSKEEISFATSVANQCAAAIENTRLLSDKLAAQEALESRKLVERAKGILMKNKNISEPEAFREIQRKSMHLRKSMKDISEAIVLADDISN